MSDKETFKEIKELMISQQHTPEEIAQVEKAYKFANKEDKKLILKCITSLAKENIKTAVEFCNRNNIGFN